MHFGDGGTGLAGCVGDLQDFPHVRKESSKMKPWSETRGAAIFLERDMPPPQMGGAESPSVPLQDLGAAARGGGGARKPGQEGPEVCAETLVPAEHAGKPPGGCKHCCDMLRLSEIPWLPCGRRVCVKVLARL